MVFEALQGLQRTYHVPEFFTLLETCKTAISGTKFQSDADLQRAVRSWFR
jgi:hypothetical protein